MASLLQSVVNHVALPPKLPFKADESLETVHEKILSRLLATARIISEATTTDLRPIWDSTRRVLQTCKELNAGGKLNKSSLLTAFNGLQPDGLLILHVTEQNSGLLIHRKARSVHRPYFSMC